MYEWDTESFVAVANNDTIDLGRFRNERGEVDPASVERSREQLCRNPVSRPTPSRWSGDLMGIATLQGVEKRYGDVMAMDGIDLDVPEGSVYGLIGPNGAGKTTSMLVISSLLARDGGKVEVAGADPQVDPQGVRRVLGYMPDFFGFYENLTATEYLDFFAAATKIPGRQAPGPNRRPARPGRSRSQGRRRRQHAFPGHEAATFPGPGPDPRPQLLVLDEPASGLDPRARVQLRELIAELSRMGKTVIISSHILSELEGICSHLAVIDDGKVKASGNLDEIRQALMANRRVTMRTPDEEVDERRIDPCRPTRSERGRRRTGAGCVSCSPVRTTTRRGILAFWSAVGRRHLRLAARSRPGSRSCS